MMKHSITCPINCPLCGCEFIICSSNVQPTDLHLLSKVHHEDQIFKLLERREAQRERRTK